MREISLEHWADLDGFDEIIDVRSPQEFEEDHIPGAVNLPVLNNDQRAIVGTLHRQSGEFEARRQGAALIAANIATHLDQHFAEKPKRYRAMIYCWRGGQRSKSMATILGAIGWGVAVLHGGYKGFRRFVREQLESQCAQLQPIILTGLTGSGKTLILRAMQHSNLAQIVDLEGIANHRGSLLGEEIAVNRARQPSQKHFETLLTRNLANLDLSQPVFVESESKRIGSLSCPECLWKAMVQATVMKVDVPLQERARFLTVDYEHFTRAPQLLIDKLPVLKRMHGSETITEWIRLAESNAWQELAQSLLKKHYDPSYLRCQNFREPEFSLTVPSLDEVGIQETATQLSTLAQVKFPPDPAKPQAVR